MPQSDLGRSISISISNSSGQNSLPAKIRTRIMAPMYLDTDPKRLDDQEYVEASTRRLKARSKVA